MAQIGAVIDGKYEILKEIGHGGMSVVYLAMDKHLNKQWAVKEIKKKGKGKSDEVVINSLLAEANMMKKLDHPALPRIVDIIDNGVTIYVIIDYIEGESLDKVIYEYGVQPEKLVIGWAKQLCDALSYLHTRKPPIIYRDMKPANIMLKPEGNIKIIDFGIAREYKELSLADTTVLGTKGYAPPEQYSGQTDPRSDIYALGMTMHHLLTGVDPRKGEVYAPVRMWNPDLSEGIEAIIEKCVQPAAENRYQNCEDLLYDLEHPELITKGYKKQQKKKLYSFIAATAGTVLCLISGTGFRVSAASYNHSSYDAYMATSGATSLEQKETNYKKAIAIYPYRMDAYLALIEAYEEEGLFHKRENDVFLSLYNANNEGFDRKSADVCELNYKVGMMYFNYYSLEDGTVDFSTRVQKAASFFGENYESNVTAEDFAYKNLSDCYYQICQFYKKYILQSVYVDEASYENYSQLLNVIHSVIEEVNQISNANSYDKLVIYNSIFVLVYDQRIQFAQIGVPEVDLENIMNTIVANASRLEVKKEQSQKLKDEILDNKDEYIEAVKRAYSNCNDKEKNNEGR